MIELSKEEVTNRAYDFLRYHENDSDERQQAQMWIRDFLEIFDIPRQKINIGFEWRVNIDGSQKYADHLLNGVLLIEMKSRNKKLEKAKSQAYRYVMNLDKADIPKYVLLSNFDRIQLFDLMNPENKWDFKVTDLPKHLDKLSFLVNKVMDVKVPSNPVNEQAARMMETLHHKILEAKYPRNYADLLMTRVVFCLFADYSGIFEPNQFSNYLKNETRVDGSDLVDRLATLFQTLNTHENERFQSEVLKAFPYINGGLFKESQLTGLPLTTEIRSHLIETASLDWSKISPVIFGSMFEGAMDENRRHSLGAHYTSEKNILKVVNSLFMDDLREEFEQILRLKRGRKQRLEEFHNKLENLKFLDPACGSGNFLIVGYRELRRLEHDVILEELDGKPVLDVDMWVRCEVAQFYGIEIVPYAVSIARVGLWLMDHLMNMEASELFGQFYARLPLHAGANVVHANALEKDWEEVISPQELNYIFGNPPFLGHNKKSSNNTEELVAVSPKWRGIKNLDYVAGWYIKSSFMMKKNESIKTALVSTNSVVQGVQAITLFGKLLEDGFYINFAHQTFEWDNNGAHVHVVIVGYSKDNNKIKQLFTYESLRSESKLVETPLINEYLLPMERVKLEGRSTQISNKPEMVYGSNMSTGTALMMKTREEAVNLASKYPWTKDFIRPLIGAQEITNSQKRYVLYLKNAKSSDIRNSPDVLAMVRKVQYDRSNSKDKIANEIANQPTFLYSDRVLDGEFLVIPIVSSGNREYIPMVYEKSPTIATNKTFQLPNASLFLFGMLESKMHMAWMNVTVGRLKSDYSYSNTLVYNTFVFPNSDETQEEKISELAQIILNTREKYIEQGEKIKDIYDSLLMPPDLRKAHSDLDKAVEKLYRKETFHSDEERVEHLIKLYQKAVAKK